MEAGPRGSEETATDGAADSARAGRLRGLSGRMSSGPRDTIGGDGPMDGDVTHPDDEANPAAEVPEEPQELRPQRKLRLWQLAPIVGLAAPGSLMFAFPLAFEPGGGSGAVVSMLGLLICGCAVGWGMMAARRVGETWPGFPARGSDRRADWRVVALYSVAVCSLIALAILRVARLQ